MNRGAWGEYDDNPLDVQDWQYIMIEVRKFADRAFVYEAPHSGADTIVDAEWDQYVLRGADVMIALDSISRLDIVMFEKLFGNSDLELRIGISVAIKYIILKLYHHDTSHDTSVNGERIGIP